MATPTYDPVSNPFSPGDDFPNEAPSATLPGTVAGVAVDYTYSVTVAYQNVKVSSWNGTEKRSSKAPGKRRWRLAFEQLSHEDADALWGHFLAQSGSLESFNYYDTLSDEQFTVRYAADSMSRETFLFEAERAGIELLEV